MGIGEWKEAYFIEVRDSIEEICIRVCLNNVSKAIQEGFVLYSLFFVLETKIGVYGKGKLIEISVVIINDEGIEQHEEKGHAYFLAKHKASHLVYCAWDEGSKGIVQHMSQEKRRR